MLKRVFFLNMLLPALAVLSGTEAIAADVTISGKVIAASCTVSPVLVGGQSVDLGTLGRLAFQHPGDSGDWQPFALSLTACPAGTTKTTVTFTGVQDSVDATLFANTEPSATAASHIAIQLAKDANRSEVLSDNSTMTVNIDSVSNTASFPLAARLYTPTGGVQAGKISSTVLVNFTYQ
ncbi:type 1 fimbrial protein [Serratia fonticola]|uniref:fimbrial protein n=1 Tax=Serratia fonticola TaxID=47917 RepID=UPI001576F824|nr:fimbrial protein [Serratia fonticola]NTY85899.1 type 1 fimbrial protein [Serratia fonticola]NTZ11790.1 type 1 fimbrial protein [Serratia fonticola]